MEYYDEDKEDNDSLMKINKKPSKIESSQGGDSFTRKNNKYNNLTMTQDFTGADYD